MFVVRSGRMLSSAALFCVAMPAIAAAQGPLAGLVGRVIAESTINRTQPGTTVVHEPHFLVGETLARSARQMNVEARRAAAVLPRLVVRWLQLHHRLDDGRGYRCRARPLARPSAERAITLGKGQTNIGFAFQSTSYDSFEASGSARASSPSSGSTTTAPAAIGNPTQPTNFTPEFQARPAAVQPVAGHQLARQRALRDLRRERQLRPRHCRAVRARGPRRAGRRPHLPHRVRRQLADPQLRHRRRRSRHLRRAARRTASATCRFAQSTLRAQDVTSFAAGLDLRLPTGDEDSSSAPAPRGRS